MKDLTELLNSLPKDQSGDIAEIMLQALSPALFELYTKIRANSDVYLSLYETWPNATMATVSLHDILMMARVVETKDVKEVVIYAGMLLGFTYAEGYARGKREAILGAMTVAKDTHE